MRKLLLSWVRPFIAAVILGGGLGTAGLHSNTWQYWLAWVAAIAFTVILSAAQSRQIRDQAETIKQQREIIDHSTADLLEACRRESLFRGMAARLLAERQMLDVLNNEKETDHG
jgi:hypothetical protein